MTILKSFFLASNKLSHKILDSRSKVARLDIFEHKINCSYVWSLNPHNCQVH